MNDDVPAYGLWPLVVINAMVFIIFAFSFAKPQTGRDWRSFDRSRLEIHGAACLEGHQGSDRERARD